MRDKKLYSKNLYHRKKLDPVWLARVRKQQRERVRRLATDPAYKAKRRVAAKEYRAKKKIRLAGGVVETVPLMNSAPDLSLPLGQTSL